MSQIEDILYEAYLQASISGSTCVFNSADWFACLTISGSSYPASGQICEYFYSSNSLDDVPTLQLWEQTVQILLSQFPDISWTTNIENNTYTITSNCDGDDDPIGIRGFVLFLHRTWNSAALCVSKGRGHGRRWYQRSGSLCTECLESCRRIHGRHHNTFH